MRVVVGVTGGIAAYKASNIIRLLTEAGHSVKVIPTQNALRFIGATTLEALSHNSVDPDLYTDVDSVKHVELGQQADLVIVAPATAAFLARYANGVADDLLLNTLLVTKAPVLVAPAMHTEMWLHPSTKQNVETLRARGVTVIEPAFGRLTGSDTGVGRLAEPEEIVSTALSLGLKKDLTGVNVLVTAGGTREPIDPVRFIGNRSSGKQGFAVARAASERGANVTLISANSAEVATVAHHIQVSTTAQMHDAVVAQIPNKTIVIMCAAVADYRVAEVSDAKLKKSDLGANHVLHLVQNPDILQEISANRSETTKVVVGFAAETATDARALENLAHSKLEAKGCDVIVANNVSAGSVFDSDDNEVLIVTESGRTVGVAGSKSAVANQLLDVVLDMLS